MGATTLLFNEAAALDALRQFITTVIPEVPQVDVYRARPSAVPSKWGLSVLLVPTTPLPVYASPQGDQSDASQRQLARLAFATAAVGPWRVRVLDTETVAYVAGGGDTTADIRDGVSAALGVLGLPVTIANTAPGILPAGYAGLDVLADVAGVSMRAGFTDIPVGGAGTVAIVDDNLRRAAFNWGAWMIRVIVRDIPDAQGSRPSMCGTYAERLRLSMQGGASIPVTNGSAFPYLRDRMGGGAGQVSTLPTGGAMNWRQTLGPFNADLDANGVWVRGVALDMVFDTPAALTHDVPSLDHLADYYTVNVTT